MKKIIILLFLVFLFSCTKEIPLSFTTKCPEIFFSKDHSVYIASELGNISADNISYKSKFNNYSYSKCIIEEDDIIAELSLLVISYPENTEIGNFTIPYYIAYLNNQNKIYKIQYYKKDGNFAKDDAQLKYSETAIIIKHNLIIQTKEDKNVFNNKILIGFMIDKQKQKILN